MNGTRPLAIGYVALGWFLVGALVMTSLGVVWARESAAPRLVLLGSGGRASLLVASGQARLLIVSGDSPSAFAAALEQARQPTQRRIDIALLAGSGDDLLAPAVVAVDPHVRFLATLGLLENAADTPELVALEAITQPRLMTLGDVRVLVESAPVATEDGSERWAWRATIGHDATTVVALSDGSAAAFFPPVPDATLVAVAGGDPLATLAAGSGLTAPAIAFADAALSPRDMRASAGSHPAVWAIRVFDGEAIALGLDDGGLIIPADAAVSLEPAAVGSPSP